MLTDSFFAHGALLLHSLSLQGEILRVHADLDSDLPQLYIQPIFGKVEKEEA